MNKAKRLFISMLTLLCCTGLWASSIPGALSGRFTINASGEKVVFSQGNLQYVGTWQFAENQWDCFSTSQYNDHRDLFGWGTGDAPNKVSDNNGDYGTFTDWGTNAITNGGNTENSGWRTLTKDEWVYLFYSRENAATLFGFGSVNGMNGLIILPDNWTTPEGASFTASTTLGLTNLGSYYHNGKEDNYSHNTYTAEQWAVMESAGAVFLPAAAYRHGADSNIHYTDLGGFYWSSTPYDSDKAYYLNFYYNDLDPQFKEMRYGGRPVRLVRSSLDQDNEGNYLIGSAYDWNLFANGINDGTIAISANAKLMADNITVTTMIGNSGHRYAGTFDGNNKTITLSISGTSGFEAPFSYINGATIKDLTVSGTLSGGIHCSGLIGVTTGTNNVNNVIVDCAITATGSHCSGLLGRHDAGTTTLNGCAFTGSISKASGNCNVGVLWGWSNGGTAILTNCLENGTYTNCSPLQPIGNLPNSKTVTNIFYVSNVSSSYGTRVYTSAQDGEVNGQMLAADGNNYYAPADISGINERYELLSSSVSPEPVVKFLGTTLTKDADYTVSYSNNTSRGTGSVIITGDGSYSGTKTVNFAVAATTLSGSGTEGSPFTIGSDDDWTEFAASVNSGFTFSGMYVKMTDNVNASSMAGQNDGEPFSGTFDGDHKTLNLSIVNTGSSTDIKNPSTGTAPFHYIKNAVIKNVKTTGSVSATSIHASGLVGFADGTNTIQGCTVSATINTTADYVGGVLAHGIISNTTIQDCTFNGTVNGRSGGSSHVVGLYGWYHGGSPVVKNCLENGTYINVSSFNPIFLKSVGASASVSGTYYLNEKNEGEASGTRVYTAVPDGEMCGQVTATDGNNYYALTTVSGINEKYELLDESVTPVPVVKFFNTTLTQNTDYTVSYSNNTSGGTGSVIITGINDYTGTKTVNFEIAANTLTGSGTEGDPYVISSDDDWTSFANSVNSGFTYSGEFVKLTKNVNATVNVGLRNNEPFSGTFDGDGHTLTVTLTANAASTSGNTEGIAPFHFIRNATIKNLRTAGTITSTTNHTSGLVGFSEGTNTFQNCVVSTTLNVKYYVGGFIGHSQSSSITIRDCLFNGTVNGSSSTYIAGIWGWNGGGSGSIVNCLENGTYTGVSSYDAIGWTPATPTNTYRINSSSKGTATTAEALADGTTTAALQNGRAETIWAQDEFTNSPMPAVFANTMIYKVPSSGIGTFSAKAKFALPDGLNAYYCQGYNDGKISAMAINGAVPANTGVILKGEPGETYTLTGTNSEAASVTDNALVAVTEETFITQTVDIDAVNYTNFGLSGGVFKKVNSKGGTVKANRAYLQIPTSALTSAAAEGIMLVWDEETDGIEIVQTSTVKSQHDDAWFTLDGRQLSGKPTAKGLYIVNGKKVIVK